MHDPKVHHPHPLPTPHPESDCPDPSPGQIEPLDDDEGGNDGGAPEQKPGPHH